MSGASIASTRMEARDSHAASGLWGASRSGALAGLRVVDLTQWIAGPLCTKWLADYGADVIKVEPPAGAAERRLGPFPQDVPHHERSGMHLYLNTSKRALTLNLKTESGQRILRSLIESADLVVESYAPSEAERLGLDYATIAAINPRASLVSISNFGHSGPYRDYAATDITVYAMGGWMYNQARRPDGAPWRHGLTQASIWGGLSACAAAMPAVLYQDVTGEGQHVDVSIAESMSAGLMARVATYSYTGITALPQPEAGDFNAKSLKVSDGYVAPIILGGMTWADFSMFLDMPELNDPRFETQNSRVEHGFELDAILNPRMLQMTKREAFEGAQAWRFPFGMVQTAEDIANCPHLEATGYWTEMAHAEVPIAHMPGALFRMTATPWELASPAPFLGEHNGSILGSLGFSEAEVVQLRAAGII